MEKKKIIYLLFTLLLVRNAIGQDRQTEFEVLAGLGIAFFRGGSVIEANQSKKIGAVAGVGVNQYLTKRFSIGAKLLYESKGGTFNWPAFYVDANGTDVYTTRKFKRNLDYITLPITLRYTSGNRIKFFGEAGVFTGYLVNGKDHAEQFESFESTTTKVNHIKKMDFGLSGSIGVLIPATERMSIKVALLENLGLLNIDTRAEANYYKTKTSSASLTLGLKYRID